MKSFSTNLLSVKGAGLLQRFSAILASNILFISSGTPIVIPMVPTLNGSFYDNHNARYNVDPLISFLKSTADSVYMSNSGLYYH
jgi:hypothetical protein